MRRWGTRRIGRVTVTGDLAAINRPRLHFAAEQGPRGDWGYVGLSYGNGSNDPVCSVEVDLGGTRVGHWIFVVYWTAGDWIDARRKAKAQR